MTLTNVRKLNIKRTEAFNVCTQLNASRIGVWAEPGLSSDISFYDMIVIGRKRTGINFVPFRSVCVHIEFQARFFFFFFSNLELLFNRIWGSSVHKVLPGCQQPKAPYWSPLSQIVLIPTQGFTLCSLIGSHPSSSLLHPWLFRTGPLSSFFHSSEHSYGAQVGA